MLPQTLLPLAGQFLLGGVFVFAGLRNIAGFDTLAGILAARGAPLPRLLLSVGIALQTVAGALVIFGLWPALATQLRLTKGSCLAAVRSSSGIN
jgi:putative oxidoreductase